jgi:hypothetical protein
MGNVVDATLENKDPDPDLVDLPEKEDEHD